MDALVVLFLFLLGVLFVVGIVILVLARVRESRASNESDDNTPRPPPGTDPDHPCKGIVANYWEYFPLYIDGMLQCVRLSDG